mmetsp:Transcript_30963/g.35554  ORF Transcript_30963/g.35554 Transcript_30963/m.35554 type:complete len:322 (-) Transcript_30963:10-975(-)
MFDVSWGEIALVGVVGITITGKRDMPRVCNFVGNQLGRVVGLLQGARVRADQFTQHNELKSLQNQLRSGLRELDQVKTEMAIAASSRGVMGRSLGSTTMSANKNNNNYNYNNERKIESSLMSKEQISPTEFSSSFQPTSAPASMAINYNTTKNNEQKTIGIEDFDFHTISDNSNDGDGNDNDNENQQQQQPLLSSSVTQTERAVMEEEWEKQGIGFRSRAEKGLWKKNNSNDNDKDDTNSNSNSINRNIYNNIGSNDDIIITDTTRATGSELLEHLERQVLIFDQYDRVVGEQEKQMKQRIGRIQKERKEKGTETMPPPPK